MANHDAADPNAYQMYFDENGEEEFLYRVTMLLEPDRRHEKLLPTDFELLKLILNRPPTDSVQHNIMWRIIRETVQHLCVTVDPEQRFLGTARAPLPIKLAIAVRNDGINLLHDDIEKLIATSVDDVIYSRVEYLVRRAHLISAVKSCADAIRDLYRMNESTCLMRANQLLYDLRLKLMKYHVGYPNEPIIEVVVEPVEDLYLDILRDRREAGHISPWHEEAEHVRQQGANLEINSGGPFDGSRWFPRVRARLASYHAARELP
ncbi:hypothetical protein QBC35DRAFT_474310 [Podospora australis]|uniref:Uncharacterized protein n=1 Tax=Podospora australis TaxID=1536484 RepID=A0AAN6WUB9_9PEZI|nr:hypothetical protein QBC35DRAFT_474310 [Podospora australis]